MQNKTILKLTKDETTALDALYFRVGFISVHVVHC